MIKFIFYKLRRYADKDEEELLMDSGIANEKDPDSAKGYGFGPCLRVPALQEAWEVFYFFLRICVCVCVCFFFSLLFFNFSSKNISFKRRTRKHTYCASTDHSSDFLLTGASQN